VRVHYDEGVAIRIGPEPCVGAREGAGEASAGERIGQPLSRESLKQSGCPRGHIHGGEGNMDGRVIASARPNPAWSETLACVEVPCSGTGRSRAWPAVGHRRSASERRGAVTLNPAVG